MHVMMALTCEAVDLILEQTCLWPPLQSTPTHRQNSVVSAAAICFETCMQMGHQSLHHQMKTIRSLDHTPRSPPPVIYRADIKQYKCTMDQKLVDTVAYALSRCFMCTHQVTFFCIKWCHGHHPESVTWNLKIPNNQSMHIYLKNILAKFHPNAIGNNEALGLFWRRLPNKHKKKNKMSSNEISSRPDITGTRYQKVHI